MRTIFNCVLLFVLLTGCTTTKPELNYPRTEMQYLVACASGHNCFRKADMICRGGYRIHVLQPFDHYPHLLIECR